MTEYKVNGFHWTTPDRRLGTPAQFELTLFVGKSSKYVGIPVTRANAIRYVKELAQGLERMYREESTND